MSKKILCIESGSIGGGSAESLYNHIIALKDDFEFYALFVRKNKYAEKIEKLGIQVFYFENTLLNIDYAKKNLLNLKFYNFLQKVTTKFVPVFNKNIDIYFHRKIIGYIQLLIEKFDIDIIHTNNQPNRDFYAIYAASKLNKKIISHIRTENSYGFTSYKIKFCNNYIFKYLSYTKSAKEYWDDLGLDSNKNIAIHNSLQEIDMQNSNIKKEVKDYTLSIIGRIRPERGYLFILDVIKELKNTYPQITLQIVGDYLGFEKYYEVIKEKISLLNIENQIIFTGYSNEVNQIISNSYALILPYNQETFGRVVLEAWQLKTPVLLSNKGSIQDIVMNNVNGMLFEYGDIDSCKNAIAKVFSDKKLYNNLVQNGFDTFVNNFTLTKYRNSFLKIIEKK